MARAQHRYLCASCGAWFWSIRYRKSILHDCLSCFWHGRHYREGTPEAARDKAAVEAALRDAYAPRPRRQVP